MANITINVLLFALIFVQLAFLAQVLGQSFSNQRRSSNIVEYVSNELCEERNLFCGQENGTLRMTSCCRVRDRYSRLILSYNCCNPAITGIIAGVVVAIIIIIGLIVGGIVLGTFCYRKWYRR